MSVRAAETLPNAQEYTVSELSSALKRTVEDTFGHVRVRGEISGFRGPHSSGHCYFALKDDSAKIEAVIWKGVHGRMRFKPQEGHRGHRHRQAHHLSGSSKYQILIEAIERPGRRADGPGCESARRSSPPKALFDPAQGTIAVLPEVIASSPRPPAR